MTTIHLDSDTAHTTLAGLRSATRTLDEVIHDFQRSLVSLEGSWQAPGRDRYLADANRVLASLRAQRDRVDALLARLGNEFTEWEECDRQGEAAFQSLHQELQRAGAFAILGGWAIPMTAGGGFAISQILPLFARIDIGNLSDLLPPWLRDLLETLFPSGKVISPIPDESIPAPVSPTQPIEQPVAPPIAEPEAVPTIPSATPSAEPKTSYEIYHSVPVRSQGDMYGSAACAPTSASMVLDYFHAQDAANNTASPDTLISMLEKGDGTPGHGISLTNMNDDFKELGYQNINVKVNASMQDLRTELTDGPVIVTTGVGIVGPGSVTADVPRTITGPGSTMHAMVVTGITTDGAVVVNDPWSGTEMTFASSDFEKMWTNGQNGMYAIHP